MAKVELHPLLAGVRGAFGRVVFKRYGNRVILSQYPDMSRVKRSPAQKAQNERVKWTAAFYREVQSNPKLLARFARMAKAQASTPYRMVLREYVAFSQAKGRVNVVTEFREALLHGKSTRRAR